MANEEGQEREENDLGEDLTSFVQDVQDKRESDAAAADEEEDTLNLQKIVAKLMKVIDKIDDPIAQYRVTRALAELYQLI